MEKFKEAYLLARTYDDLDLAMETISIEEKKKLLAAIELIDNATGLDMRQEFLLKELRHLVDLFDLETKYKKEKAQCQSS